MPEEKKIVELKDEQLNKVSGGNGDNFHCDDWVEDVNRIISHGWGVDFCQCDNCVNKKMPEGPCKLGNPWYIA